MNIKKLRKDTPGTQRVIHFNNAGASLPPQKVVDVMLHYLKEEALEGGYEWRDKQAVEIQSFYSSLAKMLHCQPQNIAFTTNATDSYNRALSSIPFKKGDIILTTIDDYASNQIAFIQLQQVRAVQFIRAANASKGGVDLDSIKELIDKYHPKLVAVTHVPTNSGLIQPIEIIGSWCKEKAILYLVDACQSVGQMPLNVEKIHCDFLTATGRKFLRGPRGTGFLYASDKVLEQQLAPLFVDMHGATWTAANSFKLSTSAQRFELWEKPYALMLGCKAAVDYAMDIGLEAIQQRVNKLAANLRQRLGQLDGVRVLDKGEQLCALVTFHSEKYSTHFIKTELAKRHINAAVSPKEAGLLDFEEKGVEEAVRLSPHYFNTEEEVDEVVEQLREIIG